MTKWYRYNIFNLLDSEAKELSSVNYEVYLNEIGLKTVTHYRGFNSVILYEDQFLPINFEGQNPYRKDGFGVYIDENYDVHLEVAFEED